MRTKFIAAFLFLCCFTSGFAQSNRVSLSGTVGYTFPTTVRLGNMYQARIRDAAQYGGMIEYMMHNNISAGFSYSRMDTHIPITTFAGVQLNPGEDRTRFNYFLLEGTKYFEMPNPQSIIMPYVGIGAGLAVVDIEARSNVTKLAWGIRGGTKVKVGSRVALLGQMQLRSIIEGIGAGMYVGTGGSGVALGAHSTILQFTFSTGLSVSF